MAWSDCVQVVQNTTVNTFYGYTQTCTPTAVVSSGDKTFATIKGTRSERWQFSEWHGFYDRPQIPGGVHCDFPESSVLLVR